MRFRWSRTCLLDPGHGPRDVDRLLTDKAQDIKKVLRTVVRLDCNRSLDSAFDNRERLELDIDISESSTTNGGSIVMPMEFSDSQLTWTSLHPFPLSFKDQVRPHCGKRSRRVELI